MTEHVGTAGAVGIGVVDMLGRKLEAAMAMLGAPTLADLTPDLLWRGQPIPAMAWVAERPMRLPPPLAVIARERRIVTSGLCRDC